MDFHTMKRKQLQALCKEHGIPANLTNIEMANKLTLLLKEKEKPTFRGRSCLKNPSEIATDNDSKDVTRKCKKVKFSPENEMIEFVDLKEDSDREIPLRMKRTARWRSEMKPVLRKSGLVVENDANTKLSEGIMENPVRMTRSRAQKSKEGDVVMVFSPPVEKKKARRGAKSGNMEVKKIDRSDNPPPVVELADNVDFRDAHFKEITESNDKILFGGGSSEPGKVPRQSKRNATKAKDSALLEGELGQIEMARRITRSRTQFVGQEASVIEIGNGTETSTEFGVRKEREVVLQLKEPTRGFGRKASKRKSVAPQNEKVRSNGALVENETGKQSRNTFLEGPSEIEASVELLIENEKVSLANGPLRRSRRNVIVKSTAPTNRELENHEIVGSIEPLEQLREPLPVKEASVHEEHLRRSRRNASRPDLIATASGMDGIANAIGKKEPRKPIRDPIMEEQTSMTECEPLIEDPPRRFTRNASKCVSIALAGLTGKAVEKHLQKSLAPQNEKVRSDGTLVENETRKQSRNTFLEGHSEIEASVELLIENEKVSLANGPLRRSRRNTIIVKSTAPTNGELGTHDIVGSIELSEQLREPLQVKEASVHEEHLRRSRRNASRPDSIATTSGMDGIANAIGKKEPRKRIRDPIMEEETSMTECEPLIKDPPRQFTRNASKRESIALAGLTGKAVEKQQPHNRSIVPILEVESPLSYRELALEEPPIVDAGVTVEEVAKSSNDPVLSHSKEVAKVSKKRRWGSKRKSSSKKQNSYLEVCPVISDVEETRDLATVLEETPAPKSVRSLSVTRNEETQISVRESMVAAEKENISMGDDKENLLQDDTHQGDEACWSQNRREDFNYDNSVEPPVDGFSSVHQSNCAEKPAHLMDLGKELESNEEASTGTRIHPSGIVADNGAESSAEAAILQETISVSHAVTDEIVAEKVSEIQFTMSGCCILGTTPLTPIICPEKQAYGNGDKVISSCGHTFVIENDEQEQEGTQANAQYLVHTSMLGRSNTNTVEGEESSSYETEIANGTMCRGEAFVSKAWDGMSSQERTEEAVTEKENEPEEASYMGRSKPAAGGETTYAGTKVNLDVEFVRVDSEGQVTKDHESGGSEKNYGNVSEEVMEKSMLEVSNGEGITLIITERDTNRVDNPLTPITTPETSGIVDKDMPSFEFENITLKDNDEHKQEEDQLKVQFSIPANTSIPIKKEKTYCHEAEMDDGTMSEGEEALASNVATGRFSQGKIKVVGAKESEHKGLAEIRTASPIISKEITDEGSRGNLEVESMRADGSIYPVLHKSSEDGCVAENKESGDSKANCESASEEGKRTHILKFSVGAETIPVISEERERNKAENLEEVSGIHEIVAESHELPADTAALNDTDIEHARISQFSGVIAPLTPIDTPECQGSCIGYKNMFSCKHSLSIDADMQEQEGNRLKVSASNTNPLQREVAFLHETENWILDESSYGDVDVVEEKSKATSVNKYSECELGKEAVNEVIEAGSLPQSALKEFLDGKEGESADVKDIFNEVLSQHSFGECSAERREKVNVTFDSNGGKGLPKEELIALSSPELVSKKLYDHEAVERNCSFDAVKDVPSSKNNIVTEDKVNDEEMKGECEVEHCDHVVNEINAEFCPEFELGDHNDCHEVVSQVNGSADSSLAETIFKESRVSDEKTSVEMMKSTSECINIIDILKGQENGGTLLPVCPVGLGQVVSDYGDEFAKMNVNVPGVSGKTVCSEASEEISNEVAKEKLIFPVKDVLMDTKNATIPQLEELMSVDLDDHKEEVLQELEQSYFIASDKLMAEDGEDAGGKENFGIMEGKLNFDDKTSGAMAVDVDTSTQVTGKDFGNYLEEEKVAEMHDSDRDDHIRERMDMLKEVGKVGTLRPAGPVGLSQVVLDCGLEFAQMRVGVPGASDETVRADGEDSEGMSDEDAKTRLQPDEANFGSHYYDHKEKVMSELDKSSLIASDAEHGEAAEGLEYIKTMESNMNFLGNNSDAEKGEDVDASPLVTQEDFGDHLVEEEVVNVNNSDRDVILDHICDNARVAVDEACVASIDGKTVSENSKDGAPVSLRRFNSESKLDVRNSAEVKLFADTSCLKPEMGSSDATVSLLNVSLSHGEEFESHIYNKDVSNDAEEKEMTDKGRGNTPTVMDMPFHEDNEVTMEKSIGAEKDNNGFNDANDGSCVEENARTSQEVARDQLGDHGDAVEEAAFVAGSDCLTSDKPFGGDRSKSVAEETEEAHGSSRKFDDMVICADLFKEFADLENLCDVSPLKPEMGGDCSTLSPVSARADHENGTAEFKVESHMFSSMEINLFLADGEEDKIKESNVGVWETTITCESEEDAREVKENAIIMQLAAEEQLGKDKHHMEEEVVDLNGTYGAFSDEPFSEDGVASMEENGVAITTKESNDSEYKVKESVEVENSCVSTLLENSCVSLLKPEMGGDALSPVIAPADHGNGTAEFKVESHMFSSMEINLFLADGEEDKIKESNVGVWETTITCESNEDAREVKENAIIMQLAAEEQLGKDKHHMEEEVADLNGTHVAFSDELISEDSVASMLKNGVAITTEECNGSEYNVKESVEVENSCVSTHLENSCVSSLKPEMGGDCSALSSVSVPADHGNVTAEFKVESHLFSSREINLFLADGEEDKIKESNVGVWETTITCESNEDAREVKENAIIMQLAAEEQLGKDKHHMEEEVADLNGTHGAFSDEPIYEDGVGVAAEDAEMQQSELEFTQKKNLDAKLEYRNSLFAKQLNSSMPKRKNIRTTLIPNTPKKLLNTLDMKENTPSLKGEVMGSIIAVKSVTNRRALEDLQKN